MEDLLKTDGRWRFQRGRDFEGWYTVAEPVSD